MTAYAGLPFRLSADCAVNWEHMQLAADRVETLRQVFAQVQHNKYGSHAAFPPIFIGAARYALPAAANVALAADLIPVWTSGPIFLYARWGGLTVNDPWGAYHASLFLQSGYEVTGIRAQIPVRSGATPVLDYSYPTWVPGAASVSDHWTLPQGVIPGDQHTIVVGPTGALSSIHGDFLDVVVMGRNYH